MSRTDESGRDGLAHIFGEHAATGSDERKIDGEWVWGFDCECGEFVPDGEVNQHLADAILASGWLRDHDAALTAKAKADERERITEAIEAHGDEGCMCEFCVTVRECADVARGDL